jgi:hypothetical protein
VGPLLHVTGETVVIRLELQPSDDSLRGRASDANGTRRDFVGWVGLVAAIDALVPGGPPAPGAGAATEGPDEP